MAISDIFESIVLTGCGGCCDKDTLCESCVVSTLRANGLPENLKTEITGLSRRWSGNGGFQYSALYDKIKQLTKEEKANSIN